jgi:hemin uptake protein HemP
MEGKSRPATDAKASAQPAGASRQIPRISSSELMRQQQELIIEHDGREYRLRITHSGKLILTA